MKCLLVTMLFVLLLSACGSPSVPTKEAPTSPAEISGNQSETTPNQSVTATVQSEPKPDEPPVEETPFDKFQRELDDAGYTYEVVPMAAELVGATSGVKYKLDFGNIEVYQFEDGSEALASAVESGGILLEGFGTFPCDFNGNLAALIDVTENKDAILDLFNSL